MTTDNNLAVALANVSREIAAQHSRADTLEAILRSALASVPGFEHAGISTVDRRGRITTEAASDDLVNRLDQLQYRLNEGPCVDAIRQERLVTVPDIRHAQRWPRYVAEAASTTGLRSQMAVQLFLDDQGTVGGLNFYSTVNDQVDPEAGHVAELFASHAAVALGKAHSIETLNTALGTRKVIGQALGILMERHRIDEDRAFGYLTRVSSHTNVKIREIAHRIVAEVEQRAGNRTR
jgi:transcriptional regulator with GAF, ATPase, and Fis domain